MPPLKVSHPKKPPLMRQLNGALHLLPLLVGGVLLTVTAAATPMFWTSASAPAQQSPQTAATILPKDMTNSDPSPAQQTAQTLTAAQTRALGKLISPASPQTFAVATQAPPLPVAPEPVVTAQATPPKPTPQPSPAKTSNDLLIEAIVAAMAEDEPAQTVTRAAPSDNLTVTQNNLDCVAKLDQLLAPLYVQFAPGSTTLSAGGSELLARISDDIILCKDAYIMVAGHTDSSGDDATNLAISWERADQALNRLIALGVDPLAAESVGFGARVPRAQGSATEAGETDRRVDFRVLRRRDKQ
ncbi:MAG: OmpA family protein [Sulfitobacter sp.]